MWASVDNRLPIYRPIIHLLSWRIQGSIYRAPMPTITNASVLFSIWLDVIIFDVNIKYISVIFLFKEVNNNNPGYIKN